MNEQYGEPWWITDDGDNIRRGDPEMCITICGGWYDDATLPSPYEMQRIVECVNLLAGIPTERFDEVRHLIKPLKQGE